MVGSAALLVNEILPHQPMRQWVLTVPFPLRFLFASQPAVMGKVLGIVYRAIATHLTRKAGYTKATARTGAVTLIQCFGGALNAHMPQGTFSRLKAPTLGTLQTLPGCEDDQFAPRVGNVAGFSLHAGVATRAHERDPLFTPLIQCH